MSNLRISKGQKSAFLWGQKSEVGQACLHELMHHQNYESIYIVAESVKQSSGRIKCISIINTSVFEAVSQLQVDDVFLCVHQFGRKSHAVEGYSIVDWNYKYPAKIAMQLSSQGASQVAFVSTAFTFNDTLSFAMRSLGGLEDLLNRLSLWSLRIYKPAFISRKSAIKDEGKELLIGLKEFLPAFIQYSGPIDLHLFATFIVDQAQSLEKGRYKLNHRDISKQLNNFTLKSK